MRGFRAFVFRAGSARVLLREFRARRCIQISYYYYYYYYYCYYYYYYNTYRYCYCYYYY